MRKSSNLLKLFAIALLSLFIMFGSADKAEALMIELSLEELSSKADSIVIGTVESTSSSWDETRENIYTKIIVSVEGELKNEKQQSTVTIVVPGGEADGITQLVSDTPAFKPGEKAIFFLDEQTRQNLPRRQIQPIFYRLTGQFQGKLEISNDRVNGIALSELEKAINTYGEDPGTYGEDSIELPIDSNWWDQPDSGDDTGFVYLGIRWSGSPPNVPYYVNTSADRSNHIQAAANTWSDAGAGFAFNYSGTHTRSGKASFNGINEIMWHDLETNYVLAVATLWFSGDRILEADMVFNTRFGWSTSGWDGHDVQTVALHEFGHWLGLDHSPEYGSIMYYQIKGTQRDLHPVDVAGIKYIYGNSGTTEPADPGEPDEPEGPVPENNHFADRITITGSQGYTTGTNVNASKETGEPKHDGKNGGRSVWWEWVAPASGSVEIDTFESNFDTILAVYTGSAVNDLTSVASNDDYGGTSQSRVYFEAQEGTAYNIAVDGWGSSSGSIALNWLLDPHTPAVPEPELYSLTILVEGEGITDPGAGYHSYEKGTEVLLEARPAEGWQFDGWIINENVSEAAAEIIIVDQDITATAVFGEINTPDPGQEPEEDAAEESDDQDKGDEGQESEDRDEKEPGSNDNSEPNPGPAPSPPRAPEPAAPASPGTPLKVEHSIIISVRGAGTTEPEPGSHQYEEDQKISILAKPADGWRFSKWVVNDLEFYEPGTTIKMTGNRTATAHFERIIPGDVTGDAEVTVADIVIVVRHTLGLSVMTAEQVHNADVNGDGVVDVRDISLLMRYTLGLIDSLPGQ